MTTASTPPIIRYYLQAKDGRCIYVVPYDGASNLEGKIRSEFLDGQQWAVVVTDSPVEQLLAISNLYTYDDDFTLDDPDMESKALPLSMGRAQYGVLDDVIQELYSKSYTLTVDRTYIDVSSHQPMHIDDVPVNKPPANWSVGAWAVFYGPVGGHVLPGNLSGFRAAARAVCEEFGTTYDHDGAAAPLKVQVQAYWSPPLFTGKKQTWMTTEVKIPAPSYISGNNLEHAQENWDKALEEIRKQLRQYSGSKACSHCSGKGRIVSAGK